MKRSKPGMTSAEAIEYLHQLKHELETQDGRCTADPYFVVQELKPVYGVDPEFGGKIVWLDSEGEVDEEEAAKLEETFDDTQEEPDGYVRTGVLRQWVTVQSFLTSKGAGDYVETQWHRHSGDLRVYGESAHRNAELKALRAAILALDFAALQLMPAECEWYSIDPEYGIETHTTSEDARRMAQEGLELHRDKSSDSWHENISDLQWGRLVPYEQVKQILDTSAEAAERAASEGLDYICDYKLAPTEGFSQRKAMLRAYYKKHGELVELMFTRGEFTPEETACLNRVRQELAQYELEQRGMNEPKEASDLCKEFGELAERLLAWRMENESDTWLSLHMRSEKLAAEARAVANPQLARAICLTAARLEERALRALDLADQRRTFAVTAVSAVSLYYKAAYYGEAARLAALVLEEPTLLGFAKTQLVELLADIEIEGSNVKEI